jgi:hypothetical protein
MIDEHAEILKVLRAAPVVARALTQDVPDAALRRRPAPGEWAAVEVIAHIADVDERAHARVVRMLAEDIPYLPAYNQDELAERSRYLERVPAAELDRYDRSRERHLALLTSLPESAWQRRGIHEAAGEMTVAMYELHVGAEDVDHLAQIARALAAETALRRSAAP